MISFDRWLSTRIQLDESYYIKDVLNECVKDIFLFVNSNTEVECDYDEGTFRDKFYHFTYNKYMNQEKDVIAVCAVFKPYDEDMYEYFTLKFSEDIINLFLGFKEMSRRYNLDLFHYKNDTSLYLEDFLFNTLLVEDPYYDSEEDNNIDYVIDECYL